MPRVEAQRFLELADGLIDSAGFGQRHSEAEMRLSQIGTQRDSPLILHDGVRRPPGYMQEAREVVARFGVRRIESQGSLDVLERLGDLSGKRQHAGEIVFGLGEPWLERKSRFDGIAGSGQFPLRSLKGAQIVERLS